MKNRLECQVSSCQHYESGLCSLPGIQVDGPGAKVCDQTCCSSYRERGRGGASASVSGSASTESSITCHAQNCAYNSNCKCGAECVCVGCCCDDVCSKSGTECCTFTCR